MMIVMHRIILTSMISVFYTHRHELNMVLDYWSIIHTNVSDSKHGQTHAREQLRSSICFSSLHRLQLMSSVVLDVFVSASI